MKVIARISCTAGIQACRYLLHCFVFSSPTPHGAKSPSGPGSSLYEGFMITLIYTHHSRQYSSGRVINPVQKPVPDSTQNSQQTDVHNPGRDSNPQIHHDNGRRLTSQIARPLGQAFCLLFLLKNFCMSALTTWCLQWLPLPLSSSPTSAVEEWKACSRRLHFSCLSRRCRCVCCIQFTCVHTIPLECGSERVCQHQ